MANTLHVYWKLLKKGTTSSYTFCSISDRGVMVNYGGMAKQPVTVPVVSECVLKMYNPHYHTWSFNEQGYLIFKDLRIVGYWNSKWLEHNVHSELKSGASIL